MSTYVAGSVRNDGWKIALMNSKNVKKQNKKTAVASIAEVFS